MQNLHNKRFIRTFSLSSALFLSSTIIVVSLIVIAACSSDNAVKTVASAQVVTSQTPAINNEKAFDHSKYEELLVLYVKDDSKVDYEGFIKDRAKLDAYLETLGKAKIAEFSTDDERNAFHINAYNAFTIRDVIDDVYKKTDSVKKVDGFWDKKKHLVGGEQMTLDEIEKVSRNYKDPRVHFAVNCASSSCPKLQRFAFTGAKLQEQFVLITKDFLSDEIRGMKIDKENKKVAISSLFSWYAGDFTGNTSSVGFVTGFVKSKFTSSAGINFIKANVTPEIAAILSDKKNKVSYLDYDWTLNSLIPPVKK
jgi:Protein of unknown function, DUF547